MRAKIAKFCAPQATKNFIDHFCNKNRKYLYRYSIPASAASGGVIAPQAKFFEILDLSKGKIDVFDTGREQRHACTNEPFTARVPLRAMCACANSRTRHTKTRLEATLPFRTLEMQLHFSLHAGLFTSGGMLPSAKAYAYARPIHLKYMH